MAKDAIETTKELSLRFDDKGLIPVVATSADTGEVLMQAWMNREALDMTLKTGQAHYWSRSRGALWHKGATSGHFQKVVEIRVDCDQDALWLKVDTQGNPACHTGQKSCFYRVISGSGLAEAELESA